MVYPAIRAKRQTLEVHFSETMPTVLVDPQRYERILLNLLSNANRYSGPRGKISVGVQIESTYLVTSVVDTGQGSLKANWIRFSASIIQTMQPTAMAPDKVVAWAWLSPGTWLSLMAVDFGWRVR